MEAAGLPPPKDEKPARVTRSQSRYSITFGVALYPVSFDQLVGGRGDVQCALGFEIRTCEFWGMCLGGSGHLDPLFCDLSIIYVSIVSMVRILYLKRIDRIGLGAPLSES